jgi:hypothetical protein
MFWLISSIFWAGLRPPAQQKAKHKPLIQETETMAKSQKHGNREAKKPKQAKAKVVAAASPFTTIPGKANASPSANGSKR